MDLKLVKIASVREYMDAHYRGEISYSKAVDLINKEANKQLRIADVINSLRVSNDEIIEQAYTSKNKKEHYNHFEENGYFKGYKNGCYWMRKKMTK
jgi:hypothetical protein